MNRDDAERAARAWIDAWNRRDIESVLALYAEDLSFTSPTALEVVGRATVTGKSALRDYWQKALARIDHLRFVFDRIVWDEASRELVILYTRHAGESTKRVAETFRFGPGDLVGATEVLHGNVPDSGH
jgi:ketosteroid isomerase-like protein